MTAGNISRDGLTSLLIGFDPRFKDDDFTLPDEEVSIYQWLHESILQSLRTSQGPVTDKYVHEAMRQLRSIHLGAEIFGVDRIVADAMKGNRRANLPTLRRTKEPARIIRSETFSWKSLDTLPPTPPDVLPGLPMQEVIVLGGAPGTMKSALALLWASAVATGASLPNGITPHWPEGSPVVLMSLEETSLRIQYRLRAIAARYPEVRDGNLENIHITARGGIDWTHVGIKEVPGAVETIREHIARIEPRLVVLDTIAQLEVEETNEVFSAVCKRLGIVAQDHDCAIVLTHHTNKPGVHNSATDINRLRGGGALPAAARAVHMLERQNEGAVRHWIEKGTHHKTHEDQFWMPTGIDVDGTEVVVCAPYCDDTPLDGSIPPQSQLAALHAAIDKPDDVKLAAVQSGNAFLFTVAMELDLDAGPGLTMKAGPGGRTTEQRHNFRVLKRMIGGWERKQWVKKVEIKVASTRKMKWVFHAGAELPDAPKKGEVVDISGLLKK